MRDIVVLRSDRVAASLLRRHPDGTWPERKLEIDEGMLVLKSIGFGLQLLDIYSTTGLSGT